MKVYSILDILLTLFHVFIILFNITGWIWPRTRKLHLISLILTILSWFLLGIWYGWGYCFLTDWHWQVKSKMGETGLPASFIKYAADRLTGLNLEPQLVDTITLLMFGITLCLTVYFNFFSKK